MADELQAYLVGGAVRDALLGRPVGDRDWVVVGSTAAQMLSLGFTPVGKDFPVFLHPQTHEEYALARTERKQGHGHRGFVVHAQPSVTLEEDLERRDLTINAIARDAGGTLIDPFGGAADIEQQVLRHVSAAFAEDPLRVFRVARFAAVLPEFSVAAQTLELMRGMAAAGELRELSAERVWREFAKALAAPAPQRFFAVLRQSGCAQDWFADIEVGALEFLSEEALLRFAELPLQGDGFKAFAGRLKAPNVYLQTALDWCAWRAVLSHWQSADADALNDAFSALKVAHEGARMQRMMALLKVRGLDTAEQLQSLAEDWRQIRVPTDGLAGPAIGKALQAARVEFINAARP